LMDLPANVWTRVPDTGIFLNIDDLTIYRPDGTVAEFIDRQKAIDGWPELRSLAAYTGLTIRCVGQRL
jgi:hypothetical protein